MSLTSVECVWESKRVVDIINSHTMFQRDRITTYNFLLKLFGIVVTLNYGQGHWKRYNEQVREWVVPSCKVWHFCKLWFLNKIPMLKSDKPRHLTDQKLINYLPWPHTRAAQFMLCIIFLVYVATIKRLNCSRWESKQES